MYSIELLQLLKDHGLPISTVGIAEARPLLILVLLHAITMVSSNGDPVPILQQACRGSGGGILADDQLLLVVVQEAQVAGAGVRGPLPTKLLCIMPQESKETCAAQPPRLSLV